MNYIKHLSAFFEKVALDDRLNASHMSLYMTLFQFWNLNRFQNPISINRSGTMRLSKIGSEHTYHKCLKDLHSWGYIKYHPSFNPTKGSIVYLCTFDTATAQDTPVTYAESTQVLHSSLCTFDTSSAQALHSSINSINNKNNKTYCERKKARAKNSEIKNLEEEKANSVALSSNEEKKRKKIAPKKEKKFIPPDIEEVLAFFKAEQQPDIESQKFYNHFEANGWLVGGKSPMKNWQAAARNWMLNIDKFTKKSNASTMIIKKDKNYDEPL